MRWIGWGLGVVVLVGVTLVTLPYLARDQLVSWLRAQGVENARLTALELDWFNGDLRLRGLRAEREGQYPLNIDRLRVDLDYAALFDKQLKLQTVSVEGLESGLRYENETQWLGPLNLTELLAGGQRETGDDTGEQQSDWSVGLDRLHLAAIDWRVALPEQQHRLEIDQLDLGAIYLWQPDIETALELKGRVNGAPFAIESRAVPLPAEKRGQLSLQIDQLPVQSLTAAFLPSLEATLTTDLTLDARLEGGRLNLQPSGLVSITGLAFAPGDTVLNADAIDWQGSVDLLLEQFVPARLDVDGGLSLPQGMVLKQGDLSLALARIDWQGRNALEFSESGRNLTGNGTLALGGAELNRQILSLNLGDARWQGDLRLDMPTEAPLALGVGGALNAGDLQLAQQGTAPLKLSLAQTRWQGQVDLALAAGGGVALIDGDHQLTLTDLALQQSDTLEASLASATVNGTLRGENLNRWTFADTELELSGIDLKQSQLELTLGRLTTQSEGYYDIASAGLSLQSPGATLETAGLSVADAPLVAFETLILESFSAGLPLQAGLTEARLSGLSFTPDPKDDALLTLAGTRLSALELAPQRLTIDSIELTDLDSRLVLDEQMQPVDVAALQERLAALPPAAGETAPPATPAEPFEVRIGRIAIAGDASRIDFIDRSTDPDFTAALKIREAVLTDFDSTGAAQSSFTLQAGVNRFASLEAEGEVNLLGSPRSGHWSLELSDMELPNLSPYSIKYTGYFLKSGQLNLDLEGTLDEDQIAGENHIRLNRLEVDPVDQSQVEKFQQQLSMPLGTAVAVLQDDNDNIDLDVPISGSLQDPEFDYQSVINRVLGKGVKQGVMSYLTQALQPYGALISLTQTAIKASRTGAFISLEPILFEPASDLPAATATDYLDQLGQLLGERSALRLNLCGITVDADRSLVRQTLEEANEDRDEPLEPDALAAAVDERLTALAESRAAAIKQRLQQRVPAERLFLCYPQIDQQGEPRVEPAL